MNTIYLYDVHVHTNMDPMIKEIDNIVSICKDKKIIFNCIGTNIIDSYIACNQAHDYKDLIYATIGIHPDNVGNYEDLWRLEQMYLEHKDVIVALGEIGLDYTASNKDHELQKDFFKKQIDIANKFNLPICVHCRDAEEDCLEILKLVKNPKKVWIHCFSKGPEIAKKYIERGYMFSIPGIVTFKNAKDINEALKVIPLDRIMLETDGPWLAPEPVRGKTNYPFNVEHILNYLSRKLQINKDELAKQFTENSIKFLGIKK